MTNDQAKPFVNEHLRPRMREVRALYGRLLDDGATFKGPLKDHFLPPDQSPSAWVDERSDVLHNVTAEDVLAAVAIEAALLAVLTPEALATIAKFANRPITVE